MKVTEETLARRHTQRGAPNFPLPWSFSLQPCKFSCSIITGSIELRSNGPVMWRFTEKFMEECVEANPSAFIHSGLEKYQRQIRIKGFRPDLLLKDAEAKIVIVEIQ
jgi:hypothetical protein